MENYALLLGAMLSAGTVLAIAALGLLINEKAGIVKPGVPVVVAPQLPDAATAIAARARALGAPMFRASEEWRFETTPEGLAYRGVATRALPAPEKFEARCRLER